jgi:hypothetical protein
MTTPRCMYMINNIQRLAGAMHLWLIWPIAPSGCHHSGLVVRQTVDSCDVCMLMSCECAPYSDNICEWGCCRVWLETIHTILDARCSNAQRLIASHPAPTVFASLHTGCSLDSAVPCMHAVCCMQRPAMMLSKRMLLSDQTCLDTLWQSLWREWLFGTWLGTYVVRACTAPASCFAAIHNSSSLTQPT